MKKKDSTVIKKAEEKKFSGCKIKGISSFHDRKKGEKRGENIIYIFTIDNNLTFCHLGDLGHTLNEKTVEKIGDVDILFIPVGGTFTIDADEAWQVIESIQPNIIVPMHYKIGGLSIPIEGIDYFLDKNNFKTLRVGNEIEIEKEDIPDITEVWIFTL